jgi:hypothetical protein
LPCRFLQAAVTADDVTEFRQLGARMRRWWDTLGRGNQAIIGVSVLGAAVLLLVGVVGAVPGWLALQDDDGKDPSPPISATTQPSNHTQTSETAGTSPATETTMSPTFSADFRAEAPWHVSVVPNGFCQLTIWPAGAQNRSGGRPIVTKYGDGDREFTATIRKSGVFWIGTYGNCPKYSVRDRKGLLKPLRESE